MLVGVGYFGRAHAVPGLFFVSTYFFHCFFVPLIPLETWLIFDDGKRQGRRIAFDGKAALMGYLRAGSLWGFAICMAILILEHRRPTAIGVIVVLSSIFLLICWVTFRFTAATPLNAMKLALEVGLDPNLIKQRYPDTDWDEAAAAIQKHQAMLALANSKTPAGDLMVRSSDPVARWLGFGERIIGKVDRVPGLLYVGTGFERFFFVPVIATRSYIVLENRGVHGEFTIDQRIPLNHFRVKSLLLACSQSLLFIVGVVLGLYSLLMLLPTNHSEMHRAAAWLAAGCCWICFIISVCIFPKAPNSKVLDLATEAGIPPDESAALLPPPSAE